MAELLDFSDREQVERWREQRLLEMGLEPRLALALSADPRVDLHEFELLLARGCPPIAAARILGS